MIRTALILTCMLLTQTSANAIEQDKLLHFGISYAVSYTGMHLLPSEHRWLAPLLTVAAGAVKELTDKNQDVDDMYANLAGIGLSIVIINLE